MDSCPGCFQSAKGQQEHFERVKTEAIAYSKEHNKAIAIYRDGQEYKYLDAFDAYGRGYGPVIREVVSAYH